MSFLTTGEIVTLDELWTRLTTAPFVENRCYRLTGIVSVVDYAGRFCRIEHGKSSMIIDTELISMTDISVDGSVQFIGELKWSQNEPKDFAGVHEEFYLRARVVRLVHNLNLELFFKAVDARRKFLESEGL